MSKKKPSSRSRPKKSTAVSLVRSSAAEYLTFMAASGAGGGEAVYADENVWLTQKMMGLLYDVETHTVNFHLKTVFADRELREDSVIRNFRITESSCGQLFYSTQIPGCLGFLAKNKNADAKRSFRDRGKHILFIDARCLSRAEHEAAA